MAEKATLSQVKISIPFIFDFGKNVFYSKSAFNENLNTIFTHSNLIDLKR
jgi:hypothetical protein